MDEGGFDPRLGRVFGFDELDLAANRAGRLSQDQAVIFANAVRVGGRRSNRMGVVVIVLFLAAGVAAAVGSGALDDAGAALPALGVAGGALVFMALLVLVFRRRDAANRAVMAAGVIETVTGPWELDPSLDGTWRVRVAGRHVGVERLQLAALADGAVYRCHLLPLPGTAALLSIERVGTRSG